MKKIVFLFTTAILFIFTTMMSCKKDNENVVEEDFVYKTIYKSGYSSNEEQLIIRTAEEWKQLKEKINDPRSSSLSSEIDFNKFMVIAVFDKRRPSSGYDVEITDISTTASEIRVTITYTSPKPTDGVLGVITRPGHIIIIHKTTKPIVFKLAQ